jgi:hypothetical protein
MRRILNPAANAYLSAFLDDAPEPPMGGGDFDGARKAVADLVQA